LLISSSKVKRTSSARTGLPSAKVARVEVQAQPGVVGAALHALGDQAIDRVGLVEGALASGAYSQPRPG
jgi:hypothetical protein